MCLPCHARSRSLSAVSHFAWKLGSSGCLIWAVVVEHLARLPGHLQPVRERPSTPASLLLVSNTSFRWRANSVVRAFCCDSLTLFSPCTCICCAICRFSTESHNNRQQQHVRFRGRVVFRAIHRCFDFFCTVQHNPIPDHGGQHHSWTDDWRYRHCRMLWIWRRIDVYGICTFRRDVLY